MVLFFPSRFPWPENNVSGQLWRKKNICCSFIHFIRPFSLPTFSFPSRRGHWYSCPTVTVWEAGDTLDQSQVHLKTAIETNKRNNHSHSLSHLWTNGQFRVTCQPNVQVLGLWEETRVCEENPPHARGETPPRNVSVWDVILQSSRWKAKA